MTELFRNGVSTRLNGALSSEALSAVIVSATGFPATGTFRCLICQNANGVLSNEEIVTVTARTGTTLTITRATESYGGSQVAKAHADGEYVTIVLTAGSLLGLQMSGPTGPTGAAGSGGLLAVSQYAPATNTSFSTTSATLADVDATNLLITFTAPASGNVLVRLSAYSDIGTSSFGIWGLRESTTNIGFPALVERGANTNGSNNTVTIYLTGISAGSHTYKWSFAAYTPATAFRLFAARSADATNWAPPAIMEVWAAP